MTTTSTSRGWMAWTGAFVLLSLGLLAAYSPAFGGSLLWNDPDYVTKPSLRSLHGLALIWTQIGATEQFYPVLHTAFWLQHRLWGDAVGGYHAANVLLHALAAILFAGVLWVLGPSSKVPGASSYPRRAIPLAALLFAFHPVAVESVAWISEEKNTLSLVFFLASAVLYLWFREAGGARAYAAAFVLYLLAVLSKSVTATLPAALAVICWWRYGRLSWRRDVMPLLPWFACGAILGLVTAWVERRYSGATGEAFDMTAAARLLLSGRIIWTYVGHAVVPVSLSFFYPRWTIDPSHLSNMLPVVGVVAVSGVLFVRRNAWRGGLAAWLLFVGVLFPVLGFLNVYGFVFSYVADHWQYMTLPVVAALGAWAFEACCQRLGVGAPVRLGTAAAAVALLAALSYREAGQYRDVESLYRSTLRRNPQAWLAHTNLGTLLLAQGRPKEALEEFQAALAIVPRYPEIHSNAADALIALGRPDEAMVEYARALAIEPRYTPALVNLAHTLVARGRPGEAIAFYRRALEREPSSAEWQIDLGVALAQAGRYPEAIESYERALKIDPTRAPAHANLANALMREGRADEALAHLRTAVSLDPRNHEVVHNLAVLLYRQATEVANRGNLPGAIAGYREAASVEPGFAEARADLGLAEVMAGVPQAAVADLREAVLLKPDSAQAHAYLGYALSRVGRPREALEEFDRALDLKPNDPDIRYQRDVVLHALGR